VNKYRNTKTTVFGQTFHSKKEAERYMVLRSMQEAGEIEMLRTQVPYEISINGVKVCKYIADFTYYRHREVVKVVEDVKGMRTGAAYQMFKLKAKLMKAVLDIEVVEI
jgi:hypothetical protein